MKKYFDYDANFLQRHHAKHTAKEINQQPRIWQNLCLALKNNQSQWQAFLRPLLADPNLNIILTGAGSSAFAGSTLAPWLRQKTGLNVHAYGTTEIVSNPLQSLSANKKTLIISYARSGNSPESLATIELADQLISDCYHLFITCNPNSALTCYAKKSEKMFELVMPEGSHDVGFAMTSSISSMMMATILVLGYKNWQDAAQLAEYIAQVCSDKLSEWQTIIKQLAKQPFDRIVYVGSGCFMGLSQEASLKVLELTAGKIATRFDSTLGLRHGPKFMVDKNTLIICMQSNDPYTRQYDLDLFNELKRDHIASQVIGLSGINTDDSDTYCVDLSLDDIWLIFPYLLFAQMLAFEKSLAVGLGPDNPCPSGEVNRVVKGVNIYPFIAHKQ
ncbi:SIS domain-containing protein [Orbus wheelerorum]|uniref:SIS domain-containing protein n=1 Tax=Orbus wheelerorum TaxID=3074111 RepID=UPI00370D7C19